MKGIVWLASYPKSGNTWLRAMLTNYRRDGDAPASINALDGGSTAAIRDTLEEWTGIDSGDLTPQQIDRYRPLVYERLAAGVDQPLFLKVHDAYTDTDAGRPLFPARATAGAVYLIRNPLDVAVSYAHHRAEPLDDTIREMGSHEAWLAGSHARADFLPQKLLSWSGHVRSWLDRPAFGVHVVRYEDLVRDPVAVFLGVVNFSGLAVDSDRAKKAVEFSTFERLQIQEAAEGFVEKSRTAPSFFRQGRVGSWRESLSDAQVQRLVDDHHLVMRRLAYLDAAGDLLC